MKHSLSGILLALCTSTHVLADADASVVEVRLSKSDVSISFVESSGGMAVRLTCESASVRGRKLYVGDGSVAIPLTAGNNGIWLQETTSLKSGDRFRAGSTVSVKPGYKSVDDLPRGSVYVILPGVKFALPRLTSSGLGRVYNLEPSSSGFRSVAFNSTGTRVALSSVSELKILDLETGESHPPRKAIRPGFPVNVVYAPDDQHVATTGWHGVHLWDLKTGRAVLHMPDYQEQVMKFMAGASATPGVAFHPTGDLIATAGQNYMTLWETRPEQDRKLQAELRRRVEVNENRNIHVVQVAFSPKGEEVATMSRNVKGASGFPTGIEIWDVNTSGCLKRMQGGGGGLAFSPDGKLIASGERPNSANVALWDIAKGKIMRTLQGHKKYMRDVAFHPNGNLVASAANDGTVRVWETATGKQTHVFTGHIGPVESLAWSPDGQRIASVSAKPPSQLIVWDVNQKEPPTK